MRRLRGNPQPSQHQIPHALCTLRAPLRLSTQTIRQQRRFLRRRTSGFRFLLTIRLVGAFKRLRFLYDLLWSRTHPIVLRKIHPADHARRIRQKLRRSSDVLSINPCAGMEQVVTTNYICVWVREKRVRVTAFRYKSRGFSGVSTLIATGCTPSC